MALPKEFSVTVKPEWQKFCGKSKEESCLMTFSFWEWEDAAWKRGRDYHLTHVYTHIDGRVSFTHDNKRYDFPARQDIAELADNFDADVDMTTPRVFGFRLADAKVTTIKHKPASARRGVLKTKTFKLDKRRKVYHPVTQEQAAELPARTTTFKGTTEELREAFPSFTRDPAARDTGQLSARRQRFNAAQGRPKDSGASRTRQPKKKA
jgi:hypothetical protein